MLRLGQDPFERTGPVDRLIEKITFRLTAAGDQDAIQRFTAAQPRHFRSALAVAVHVEAHDGLELGQRLAVEMQTKPLMGKTDVVSVSEADPRPSGQFHHDEGDRGRQDDSQQRRHTRLHPRRKRGVRST